MDPYNMRFGFADALEYLDSIHQLHDMYERLRYYRPWQITPREGESPSILTLFAWIKREYGNLTITVPVSELPDAIAEWCEVNAYALTGMWESTQQSYNMVENYDKISEIVNEGRTDSSTAAPAVDSDKLKQQGTVEGSNKNTLKEHTHGNIGVTTAAQMLESERRLHEYSYYKAAAALFAQDLLELIYW